MRARLDLREGGATVRIASCQRGPVEAWTCSVRGLHCVGVKEEGGVRGHEGAVRVVRFVGVELPCAWPSQ